MQITEDMLSKEAMARISERGDVIYDQLQPRLEPLHDGKVVAIRIDTGDYEVAARYSDALKAIETRHTNGLYYVRDIGTAKMDGLTMRMLGNQFSAETSLGANPITSEPSPPPVPLVPRYGRSQM